MSSKPVPGEERSGEGVLVTALRGLAAQLPGRSPAMASGSCCKLFSRFAWRTPERDIPQPWQEILSEAKNTGAEA